jgi:formate/nitrite transporter
MNEIQTSNLDALLPQQMATKAERIGAAKANLDTAIMFALAFLAGAFIALGGAFATCVATGGNELPFGVIRLLTGLAFSLGLILVVVGGAELFTGNNLIVMTWAAGNLSSKRLLRNWAVVYLGNTAGAGATALLVFASGQYKFAAGQVGLTALRTADFKASLEFHEAFFLGILCNILVCLAVWLSFSARTTTDRILAVMGPIAAFVACGFEHCVANLYFIPIGLLIKNLAPTSFWESTDTAVSDFAGLTWQNGFVNNLLPVTLGNIVGGAVIVGGVYWFIYLRQRGDPHN